MNWSPYPAYKPSGVEWLGDIPAHWEVKRLKNTVTTCQNGVWGDEPTGNDDDLVCIRVADFDRVRNRVLDTNLTMRSIPASQRRNRLLRRGDLLLEKSGGGELQPVGVVVLYDLDIPAVSSNFVASMSVAEGFDPFYLCYLHAAFYSARLNICSIKQNTGIQNLDSYSYLCEKAGIPPLDEQRAIAAFLDRETAKLDALIAKHERLIELLQEKRTALISHAVTKGLGPSAPMKDSGVAWLGQIPAHWEVRRLKNISPSQFVGVVVNPSRYVVEEGIPFLFGSDISEGHISVENARRISPESNLLLSKSILRAGDLITVRVGYPGVTAVVPPELDGCNCASMMVIKQHKSFCSQWLCYTMNSRIGHTQVELVQYGAAQEQFNISHAVSFVFPVPPLTEQYAIVTYLDRETAKLDVLIAKIRDSIGKLREYRAALISAAVMGKIDVRDTVDITKA